MKTSSTRRIRRRQNISREGANPHKEGQRDQKFFGPEAHEPFFQPTAILHRTPEAKPEEKDKLHRALEEKKEEGKHKRAPEEKKDEGDKLKRAASEEKDEKDKLHRAPEEKNDEKDKLHRAPEEKKDEGDKLHRAATEKKDEKDKLDRAPDENKEDKLDRAPEEKKEEKVHRKESAPEVGPSVEGKAEAYISNINGKGQPLPEKEQAFFGERLDHDFSGVKIHTGQDAADSAKDAKAKAYTYGNHVVFNEGQYNTESHTGKTLLAHELTHVVQQGSGPAKGKAGPGGGVHGKAGRQVQRGFWSDAWDVVSGVGSAIVGGVKSVAGWGWDVVKSAGAWMWDAVTWLPSRVWSILKHFGSGIVGIVTHLWNGLVGALGHLWEGLTGLFSWLGEGLSGLFGWIWRGFSGGAQWASRLLHGDFSAFWDGIGDAFSWLGGGVKGLLQWGWKGLEGLVIWGYRGIAGLARWCWDGLLGGLAWIGRYIAKIFDLLGAGELWTLFWNIFKGFSTRTLTGLEAAEAAKVFAGSIAYWQVRIDEMSLIAKIGAWAKGASGMGVTTASTINFNRKISAAAGNGDMAWLIHELGHVAQYTHVGLQYLGEAIHAQATGGYDYGGGAALVGKNLGDFNREQQADILRDYYAKVLYGSSPHAAEYTRMRNQAVASQF
jgi:Domain of unknown function (DUF4157)